MKEREDLTDCLDNDLQQIFGSVISPDLEIMKQEEEEKVEGHCCSFRIHLPTVHVLWCPKEQYGPEKMPTRQHSISL